MRRVVIAVRQSERAVARRLPAHGWRNSGPSASSYLAYSSDVVVVGLLLNPVAAAGYAIAVRASTLLAVSPMVSRELSPVARARSEPRRL
jgi:O-antigen/teichoic acid export membrane protein